MSTHEHSRRAHELVDAIKDGYTPDRADVDFLRSFLPELPKRKTLEELRREVYDVWAGTIENEWPDDMYCSLENWLYELHEHLKGLKDVPVNALALPAGMRLADHKEFGRVVATDWIDSDNEHFCVFRSDKLGYGTYAFLPEESLTFIDAEPAKPVPEHPEFLETEADYENAPEGTIVACEDSPPWHKFDSTWLSTITHGRNDAKRMTGIIRCVLRWGWGK